MYFTPATSRHVIQLLTSDFYLIFHYGRTWHARIVVCTNEKLYFSRTKELVLIDMIPLHEVISVSEMKDTDKRKQCLDHTSLDSNFGSRLFSAGSQESMNSVHEQSQHNDASDTFFRSREGIDFLEDQFDTFIQIKTTPDGFNSGRTYYLQTKSEELRQAVVDDVSRAVESAKSRLAGFSWFRNTQKRVGRVYNSMRFQIGVAFLIIAVSNRVDISVSSPIQNRPRPRTARPAAELRHQRRGGPDHGGSLRRRRRPHSARPGAAPYPAGPGSAPRTRLGRLVRRAPGLSGRPARAQPRLSHADMGRSQPAPRRPHTAFTPPLFPFKFAPPPPPPPPPPPHCPFQSLSTFERGSKFL